MSRQNLSWQHLSISGTSHLILTRFWPNFKGRFIGPSLTDSKCHSEICTGNVCPDNFFYIMNSSDVPDPILTQFSGALIFLDQHSFWPKFFRPKIFWTWYFFGPKVFRTKFFLTRNLFDPTFFGNRFFGPTIFRI